MVSIVFRARNSREGVQGLKGKGMREVMSNQNENCEERAAQQELGQCGSTGSARGIDILTSSASACPWSNPTRSQRTSNHVDTTRQLRHQGQRAQGVWIWRTRIYPVPPLYGGLLDSYVHNLHKLDDREQHNLDISSPSELSLCRLD